LLSHFTHLQLEASHEIRRQLREAKPKEVVSQRARSRDGDCPLPFLTSVYFLSIHARHHLEGNGFMAVTAFAMLDYLRQLIEDGIVLDGLPEAAEEAAAIMAPAMEAQQRVLTIARQELDSALANEIQAKAPEEDPPT
jgi:hypothetical protein